MKDLQLIWDFDDTIVYTNREFERTNHDTATIISRSLMGDESLVADIMTKQRLLDLELVKTYGFVPARYVMSWLQTYESYATSLKRNIYTHVKDMIQETVNDLYIRQFENIQSSHETLELLRKEGQHMIILTAGVEEIQNRKILQSGVREFVEEVIVYPYKTPSTFKDVMARHQAKEYVMIGNSLKSDIYPALENDAWGFHFEQDTWEADHHDVDTEHAKYVHIPSLTVIPEKLQNLNKQSLLTR